jgi:hypothetical protein
MDVSNAVLVQSENRFSHIYSSSYAHMQNGTYAPRAGSMYHCVFSMRDSCTFYTLRGRLAFILSLLSDYGYCKHK